MKKMAILLLTLLMLVLPSCKKKPENGGNGEDTFDPNANLDLENIFFDDFSNGIDPDVWEIAHRKWQVTNNGVIFENVNYTEDGTLVLQANGDNYAGPFKGYESDDGRRTGAAIITNKALGPGRFEVRMKILPRFGATSAIWTFYYDSVLGLNQEIDIELNVRNDFRTFWVTHWITEVIRDHSEIKMDILHNDGEYHIYRFDWHTNPRRIDYYVDNILVYSSTLNVPNHAGRFWVGHWFPEGWAGTPDFETDYMFVDWVKYTPYLDNPYVETEDGRTQFAHKYPREPIKKPVNNLISNPRFDGREEAWRRETNSKVKFVEEGLNDSMALHVPKNDIAYQFISGMDETFELTMTVRAKLNNINDKGYVLVELRPLETSIIDSIVIEFSKDDPNFVLGEYYEKTVTFKIKSGTKRLEVSLIGSEGEGIYFDEVYLNMISKPYSLYKAQFE